MDQVIISAETCKTACRALSFMIADLSEAKVRTTDAYAAKVFGEEIETCKRALALASRAVPVSPAQDSDDLAELQARLIRRTEESTAAAYRDAELIRQLREQNGEMLSLLKWYRDHARLTRLIHSEGDAGRHALANDGGEKANTLIAKVENGGDPS